MTKFKKWLSVALLAASTFAVADGVMMDMYGMKRQMNGLFNAESVESFQQSANAFIEAATKARDTMPNSLEGDQEEFKGYQQGMQAVIDVVQDAEKLAAEGKLDEAKAKVQALNELKQTYHKKYK